MTMVNLSLITGNVLAWVAQERDPWERVKRISSFFRQFVMNLHTTTAFPAFDKDKLGQLENDPLTESTADEGCLRALLYGIVTDNREPIKVVDYTVQYSSIRVSVDDDLGTCLVNQEHAIFYQLTHLTLEMMDPQIDPATRERVLTMLRELEAGIPDNYITVQS